MRRADNHTTFICLVLKSGSLNLLERSGRPQACSGIALLGAVGLLSGVMCEEQDECVNKDGPSGLLRMRQVCGNCE